MMDLGFISTHNKFTDWRAVCEDFVAENDAAMFQCSESSADNWFNDIRVTGQAGTYKQGFRLQSVRDFRIERITLRGIFDKGAVERISHDKESFLFLYPELTTFDASQGLKLTPNGPVTQTSHVPKERPKLKDPTRPGTSTELVEAFWPAAETDPAFRNAAVPGAKVYDSIGRKAWVVYGVRAEYPPNDIVNWRDSINEVQLKIWNEPATYPQLKVTSAGPDFGKTYPLIDMIYLTASTAWFAYSFDPAAPASGLGTTFTCSEFPGVTFTVTTGIIDDDNDQPQMDNVTGRVDPISGTEYEIRAII